MNVHESSILLALCQCYRAFNHLILLHLYRIIEVYQCLQMPMLKISSRAIHKLKQVTELNYLQKQLKPSAGSSSDEKNMNTKQFHRSIYFDAKGNCQKLVWHRNKHIHQNWTQKPPESRTICQLSGSFKVFASVNQPTFPSTWTNKVGRCRWDRINLEQANTVLPKWVWSLEYSSFIHYCIPKLV